MQQGMQAASRATARVGSLGAGRRLGSNIAGGSMGKKWADKEHAAESQFFNKRDAELLQQLASKLHSHTTQPTDGVQAKHRAAILAVFEKHAVTPVDALVDDIVKAKFN